MSNLVEHAKRELTLIKFLGDDCDEYDRMVGEAVIALLEKFSEQGHSGFSAYQTIGLFNELAQFHALSPLTDDPEEWMDVSDNLWQNRRQSSAFSDDGGKTYWDIDESDRPVHQSQPACLDSK